MPVMNKQENIQKEVTLSNRNYKRSFLNFRRCYITFSFTRLRNRMRCLYNGSMGSRVYYLQHLELFPIKYGIMKNLITCYFLVSYLCDT